MGGKRLNFDFWKWSICFFGKCRCEGKLESKFFLEGKGGCGVFFLINILEYEEFIKLILT